MGRGQRWSRHGDSARAAPWVAGGAALLLLLGGGEDSTDDTSGAGGSTGSTGTGSGSGTAGPSGGGTTTDPALEEALARLSAAYDLTPGGIAQDIGLDAVAPVSATEVQQVATALCTSIFDPAVVLGWLGEKGAVLTWLVAGPTARLLAYSGSPTVCSRGPTPEETSAFLDGIWAALPDPLSTTTLRQPTATENVICEFLGSQPGGAVVEGVVEGFIEAATRGRADGGDAVALGVEVAGAVCPTALPAARAALQEHLGGG